MSPVSGLQADKCDLVAEQVGEHEGGLFAVVAEICGAHHAVLAKTIHSCHPVLQPDQLATKVGHPDAAVAVDKTIKFSTNIRDHLEFAAVDIQPVQGATHLKVGKQTYRGHQEPIIAPQEADLDQ